MSCHTPNNDWTDYNLGFRDSSDFADLSSPVDEHNHENDFDFTTTAPPNPITTRLDRTPHPPLTNAARLLPPPRPAHPDYVPGFIPAYAPAPPVLAPATAVPTSASFGFAAPAAAPEWPGAHYDPPSPSSIPDSPTPLPTAAVHQKDQPNQQDDPNYNQVDRPISSLSEREQDDIRHYIHQCQTQHENTVDQIRRLQGMEGMWDDIIHQRWQLRRETYNFIDERRRFAHNIAMEQARQRRRAEWEEELRQSPELQRREREHDRMLIRLWRRQAAEYWDGGDEAVPEQQRQENDEYEDKDPREYQRELYGAAQRMLGSASLSPAKVHLPDEGLPDDASPIQDGCEDAIMASNLGATLAMIHGGLCLDGHGIDFYHRSWAPRVITTTLSNPAPDIRASLTQQEEEEDREDRESPRPILLDNVHLAGEIKYGMDDMDKSIDRMCAVFWCRFRDNFDDMAYFPFPMTPRQKRRAQNREFGDKARYCWLEFREAYLKAMDNGRVTSMIGFRDTSVLGQRFIEAIERGM